ncbi:DUF2240 family protein [Halomicrobium urmianum]|uniref:DUF2240 family protein n=1 Tax=Halomicrobium urmianum TaxID=1586233 RepID=UPI001CDA3F46|nr:DUF2240 family protein [Halomicrobium urmianum]
MSLRRTVAAPFRTEGSDRMSESEFVVALSLDRDWFSPDQAKRLVDVAASEGLLERDDDAVVAAFDFADVTVPEDFAPDESVLQERSTFERVLDAVVETGVEKQDAVAAVNRLQTDLGVTLEAAAVVYARRQGVDVTDIAERARGEL